MIGLSDLRIVSIEAPATTLLTAEEDAKVSVLLEQLTKYDEVCLSMHGLVRIDNLVKAHI